MKKYVGVEIELHAFLTIALSVGEENFTQGSLYLRARSLRAHHWNGGWMGPRAGLDTAVAKREKSRPFWESNTGHSASSLYLLSSEIVILCILKITNSSSIWIYVW
jgi:hypothetical protein